MHLLLRLYFLFALLASCAPAPENKPAPLDESNLELVLPIFYHPGRRISDTATTYKLLSTKTREQVTPDQWAKIVAAQTSVLDTAVIVKKEVVHGVTYGVVSLSETVDAKKTISTATWVLEENKWRRIKLPLSIEAVDRAFRNNNNGAARKAANAWLVQDPFSTQAVEALILCAERSGERGTSSDEAIASLMKKLLAINPDDTRSLFVAVSHARDLAAARPYLKKLEGTVAYQAAVDVLVANSYYEAQGGASGNAPDADAALIQRLVVLADLNDILEFARLGSDDKTHDRLARYLAKRDPGDAADYAGRLGIAYHKAGNNKRAVQWLEFGKELEPGNERLQHLEALLEKSLKQ